LISGLYGLSDCFATEAENESLDVILKEQSRWGKIEYLQSCNRELSEDEINVLERFEEETKHCDWMMNYYAQLILRRSVPDRHAVTPQVAKAEELFTKMRAGKVANGTYDIYLDEIKVLGNDVTGFLLDFLNYREQHDYFRKDIAI
jgi:hypothetical protein